jgi:hypothetical protein
MSDQDEHKSIPLTIDRVERVLAEGTLSDQYARLNWSSNYAFLADITLDEITLTSVYKPQRGERPLWDFPDGTLCYRERASYLTSQALEWQIVPPTVLREGMHGIGSFQFFIDHDPEVTYFQFDSALADQLRRICVFDTLVNNADRKGGHCLLDSELHIWGIDQGLTFNTAHKLRTVIWDYAGQAIPDDLLADVERVYTGMDNPENPLREQLCHLLDAAEIAAFQARMRKLLKTRMFPTPGAGPNYPWPPV